MTKMAGKTSTDLKKKNIKNNSICHLATSLGYLAEIAVPDAGRGSRLEKTMRGQPSPPLLSFPGEPADKKYIL